MKVVKIILSIFGTLVSAFAMVCLCWGLLYLCISPVKDWTDKNIFKTETVEEVKSSAQQTSQIIDYENKVIKVEV